MKSLRLFFFFVLLLGSGHLAQGQRVAQVTPLLNAYYQGSVTATDPASGTTYIFGVQLNTLYTSGPSLPQTPGNVFLACVTAGGTVRWLRSIPCNSLSNQATSIALDGRGHMYLTGLNGGGATFGSHQLDSAGFFVARYDTAGTAQWVRPVGTNAPGWYNGGNQPNIYVDVVAGQTGHYYLHGRCVQPDTLGGRSIPAANFMARCDSMGRCEWMESINGAAAIDHLALDPAGNCTIVGSFNDRTIFGTGTDTISVNVTNPLNGGHRGNYVARYNAAGRVQWVRTCIGTNAFERSAFDAAGNTYVLAQVYGGGTCQFDGIDFPAPGFLLLKLSPTGVRLWHQMVESPSNTLIFGSELAVDPQNSRATVGGTFQDTCRVGNDILTAQGAGVFVMQCSPTGTIDWATPIGAPAGSPGGFNTQLLRFGLAVSVTGDVYVTSYYFGSDGFSLPIGPFTVPRSSVFVTRYSSQTNRLKGQVYLDANSNGFRDRGESAFPRTLSIIELNQQQAASSDPGDGTFTVFANQGAYDLRLPRVPTYYQLSEGGAGYQGSFAGYAHTDTARTFGLAPVANQRDLRVSLTPYTEARVGIPMRYRAHIENVGTSVVDGQLTVVLDTAASLIGTVPPTTPGSRLTWSFTALAPFAALDYDVTLSLPLNVPVGQTLVSTATVVTTGGDLTPADNVETLRQTVVGSSDPNDISVNFTTLTAAQITAGESLDYIVRFQNVGTAMAYSVVIQDTLPAALLQLGTVQMISQSHNVQWMLSGPGLLTIRFPGIQLPQQAVDAVRSQGFVRFRIVPRTTLVAGTLIPNHAHITFDFNAPVATNEAITLVQNVTGLPHEPGATALSVYPNPAPSGSVTLTADMPTTGAATVTVVDALGRAVRTETVAAQAGSWVHEVKLASLAPGVYAVRLTVPSGGSTSRRLVVR